MRRLVQMVWLDATGIRIENASCSALAQRLRGVCAWLKGRKVRVGELLSRDLRPNLEERLRRSYGLTRAEARVAVLIAQGLVPKEAAAALGTSWNTVRTQLCRVFAKTGTTRQLELARLLERQA